MGIPIPPFNVPNVAVHHFVTSLKSSIFISDCPFVHENEVDVQRASKKRDPRHFSGKFWIFFVESIIVLGFY